MAVKTFSVNEVLTATDTNTYLANAGLVYVKSQTINSGATSVAITNAFSTEYDSYKIIVNGGSLSGVAAIAMYFTGGASDYYGSLIFNALTGTSVVGIPSNPSTSALYVGVGSTNYLQLSVEVHDPFKTMPSRITADYTSQTDSGRAGYLHLTAASYTGFTLTSTANFTGGTLTVFGYRKA